MATAPLESDVLAEGGVSTTVAAVEMKDVAAGLERLNIKCPDREERPAASRELKPIPQLPLPTLKGNQRDRPLTLTNLPIDVLKDIVKEVTHTNDLTNLCLTCRALHSLAVPQIYSRFDIVWPEIAQTGDRVGVDALTHGLATLTNVTRRGNDHARWVKKFSLGNGPAEWVNEYNINKEGGKMLGTLANLAIARMDCLETFSWDMPTGILRDIFMTLHDLNSTLKNIHVRFHDNRETAPPSTHDISRNVETPTFKGFKGLRSLSVLDIDEQQYLEEMSYAVENSVDTLKELKVGVAQHMSLMRRWIKDWDDLENIHLTTLEDEGAVGGILGLLLSKIVNLEDTRRRRKATRPEEACTPTTEMANTSVETAEAVVMTSAAPAAVYLHPATTSSEADTPTADPPAVSTENLTPSEASYVVVEPSVASTPPTNIAPPTTAPPPKPASPTPKAVDNKVHEETRQLKLHTLALERVPISVSILVNTRSIDWSVLQNLTILNCYNHERLWRTLKKKFCPVPLQSSSNPSRHGHASVLSSRARHLNHHPAPSPSDYKLRLKKLHTDCVTVSLISFITQALAANSLEILFLQEATNTSTVTMDVIFKGIKRHRGSLRKLLVDSKHDETAGFFKWTFGKEQLNFMGSGKMPNLRELGMAIEHKDWHHFLTLLPRMRQLRSLFITHIRDAPHITTYAHKELANQILNTVILRPEIELCYIGIINKCFEILEGPSDEPDLPDLPLAGTQGALHHPASDGNADEESDGGDWEPGADSDEDDDEEEEAGLGEDTESDDEDLDTEEQQGRGIKGIRLREILFYDDKVEIFRARNARL